jgi:hypothetical protein
VKTLRTETLHYRYSKNGGFPMHCTGSTKLAFNLTAEKHASWLASRCAKTQVSPMDGKIEYLNTDLDLTLSRSREWRTTGGVTT